MTGAPRTRRTRAAGRLAVLALGLHLLAGLAAGCGSKERGLVREVEAQCTALQGKTMLDADQAFSGAFYANVGCRTDLIPLPGDECPGAVAAGAYSEPVCRVTWFYFASDPGLCGPGGDCRYGCEARVADADLTANQGAAVICAVRGYDRGSL